MPSEDRRFWVAAEVDEGTHRTLYHYACETGRHPTQLIEEFIVQGLENAAKEAESPSPVMRTYLAVRGILSRRKTRSQLEQIAHAALTEGDEDMMDELATLCGLNGESLDEVLAAVKLMREPPILITDNGNGITSAMRWLRDELKRHGELPAQTIKERGKAQGFSAPTLNAAKVRIKARSVRRAKCWVWTLDGNGDAPPLKQLPDEVAAREPGREDPL